MPVERNDPNPRRDEAPESTAAQTTNWAGQPTEGGTLAQVEPPVWVTDAPSAESRSGKEVYELDREIARGQAGGAESAEGYTLLRRLGTGSFGTVWEAENRLTHERVAIKFFTAGHADWAKLLGEVGLLQQVEGSGGIVMVKEVRPGQIGQRPHYVMQLANGGSLADWLKTADALPPRERVRLAVGFFTRAARAMAAVHRRGIHHCDLKPHNILLHSPEPGAAPEPLVADFGQAQLATDDTPALGTFFYMPPDQIDAAQNPGTPPDTRWDVYALGAVAYEMLTGAPPRRSPELVERIKKAPRHLPTKMAVYREGILAADRPMAHYTVADPMLAKIIDRCLTLRPERRPADAGALVALLETRARWRRTRPVLALAAVATLLLIALVATVGVLGANEVTHNAEKNVTQELTSSLARTAGYSVPAVERRLQRQVGDLEMEAANAPPDVIAALAELGDKKYGPRFDPNTITESQRQALVAWMRRLIDERNRAAGKIDPVNSISLMVVTEPGLDGATRGFFVARGHPDGTTEDFTRTKTPGLFRDDYSYRDYFHGRGNLLDQKGQPHVPIRATHISDPYQSTANDRTTEGVVSRQWKVNVATPVWAPDGRLIGMLTTGMNLEDDLVSVLEPIDLGARGSEKLGIARRVKVVLIDHRNHWIWHSDCREWLENRPDLRLPHNYTKLAEARGRDPRAALPWLPEPGAAPRRYVEANDYVDLVEDVRDDADRNDDPEIACFTRFSPYATSRYPDVRDRQWVFVAQVDRKVALSPLEDLRNKIVGVGAVAGAVLVLLAVGLWVGLVVVLRRLEFGSHG